MKTGIVAHTASLDKRARRHWVKLMGLLGHPEDSEEVFHHLLKRYNEPGRWHHVLAHVVSMLDELEECGDYDPVIAFAIWFHDAVYDPRSKDNEFESAHLARRGCHKMAFGAEFSTEVCNLILATQHTETPKGLNAQIIVDLDLAILGKPEAEFDTYEINIRKEYEWVPAQAFREGRAKILQSFLERPAIYSLPFFRNKYETAARVNLARSIQQLQS
jgi:predicted metal-dependent HD superfamily phosphohydrolase